MRISKTLIATILIFVIINTQNYWIAKIGFLLLPISLILLVGCFVIFLILVNAVKILHSNKKSTGEIIQWILSILLLASIIAFPKGIVEKQYAPTKIKAFKEGVGGCGNTLYLREDSTFLDRSVCFGIQEIEGRYRISNDTIYFNSKNYKLDYGIIDSIAIRCHLKKDAKGKERIGYIIAKDSVDQH